MKKTSFAALALGLALLSGRAAAQVKTEVGVFGTWIHSTSRTVTNSAFDIAVEFEDGGGGGFLVDVRPWRLVSFEVSGLYTRQSGAITASGSTLVAAGHLEAMPVVLEAKFHPLGDGVFDLYFGGGGTYVWFHDLSDAALDAAGIGTVTVKGKAGLVAAAGFRLAFAKSASFFIDGKYLAVKPESQGVSGSTVDLNWNPLLVSAGFGFRF
jgi:outer membrane protein W